ncbi:OsmC family protein [Caulobacter sp. RL271]|jgi:putative redox protein|uniref:OsmC family protein n=1 Tax=Caulobacter segnis TaxID=88688 RepID=A0ABY5A1W3_9CAUL|nr:OsmC family protein [Caulobacter segnis]USQ98121.1 OsmC family protein [Caulobacter segnis]
MPETTSTADLDLDAIQVRETGVGLFQVEIQARGARFLADEPVGFGGMGSGPDPYDLLAAALGACTTMTLRLYARRKAWPLEEVSVRVSHARDSLTARDAFNREITVTGALDEAQRVRLGEIADRCPVHQTLARGADVVTRFVAPAALGENGGTGLHMRHMSEACEQG